MLKIYENHNLIMVSSAFIYLFGVLRRFQHCTGHITTGSSKGRGNQYIEFARVVYCKLPTNGKQLPAFPLKAVTGIEPPTSEVGGESVTTLPPWPLVSSATPVNQLMSLICTMSTYAVLCEFLMDFHTLHEHYIWKPE